MVFEEYLDNVGKSKNFRPTYTTAIDKINEFLNNNEFYHDGAEEEKVLSILIKEENWKYDREKRKIYDYREYLSVKYSEFYKKNIKDLSIDDLKSFKKKCSANGDEFLYAINMAYGPGALSAAIKKLIEWKEMRNLKLLQLEFWDELRKIYLDNKILKRHEHGIDIKFNEEFHIYIAHLNNQNLITIKLYIPENKELFKIFQSKKEEIEKEIGEKLIWNLKDSKATTISRNFNFNIEKRETWRAMLDALSKEIIKFINIFVKYKNNFNTSKNLNDIEGEKMEYQRIVYGAPGTGKSYMLKKESEDNFLSIKKSQKIIDGDDAKDRGYWLVGSFWGTTNMFQEFIDNGYWENGWNNKFLDKVNSIKVGDYIGIKTLNRHKNETTVKALGIVTKNENNGTKIMVDWKVIEEKVYPGRRYNSTIHRIYSDRLDMFDPLVEFEKNNGKDLIELETEIKTIERVTFYDGYTYGQFVGTYKPIPSENNKENIVYKYVPGPLVEILVRALKYPNNNFLLIIEEINRAKADRVFGNIFQLLDRFKDGNSEYPISIPVELEIYLKEQFDDEQEYLNYFEKGLSLPSNLYIWATMNNADQGVYPLDTAFKRRWNFEYIGLNENADKFSKNENEYYIDLEVESKKNDIKIIAREVSWNNFREVLNKVLLENGIYEDRLIAPFFIKPDNFIKDIEDQKDKNGKDIFWIDENAYINKLMMYIFDDILKHKKTLRDKIFHKDILSFSILVKRYKKNEVIFSDEFLSLLKQEDYSDESED